MNSLNCTSDSLICDIDLEQHAEAIRKKIAAYAELCSDGYNNHNVKKWLYRLEQMSTNEQSRISA